LAGIDSFQTFEGFVQGQKLDSPAINADREVGETEFAIGLRSFPRFAGSSLIDKYTPHQPCRYRKKMRSAFPVDATLIDEAEIDFMDQGGGLLAVVIVLPQQVTRRQSM